MAVECPNRDRKRIITLAARYRLPAMYEWRESAEEGVLMAYGPNFLELNRRVAIFVNRLNHEINEVIANPDVVSRMRELGLEAAGGTPEALHTRLRNDIAKWAKVIETAKIAPQ